MSGYRGVDWDFCRHQPGDPVPATGQVRAGTPVGPSLPSVAMIELSKPSLGIVLLFLFFSLIFLSNSYRLWFKTDQYYQDLYNSLTREPTLVPFKDFFLKRMENKKRWVLWQKAFSAIGVVAVLVADFVVVRAYLQ